MHLGCIEPGLKHRDPGLKERIGEKEESSFQWLDCKEEKKNLSRNGHVRLLQNFRRIVAVARPPSDLS